ncbi:Crp/Fnr family transcriptional regulator [Saccharothrix coeruleofusca]|uniref:Crp/Fnr family transcriptional regulator n=1 Tax=Saccharothrix coeruleofusca TaxID=33919 RepID=UPI0016707FFE|nr:Crp/Fnr family transcriptional regulator [Saccharothrix coeruleofusca]MBP2334305.1 CRP-like cAMP-binding protein [Saccharothrix coeruleofusca]
MSENPAERGLHALRAAAGRRRRFRKGDILITAGDTSDEALLIESGLLKVVLPCDGHDPLVSLVGPGTLVGELGLIWQQPRSAHVIALRDGEAAYLAARVFMRLRQENEDVRTLVEYTAYQRQVDNDARQLAQTRGVFPRVVGCLLRWSAQHGRRTEEGLVLEGLSQREIAQAVNASERRVETLLKSLRESGLLRTRRLRYVLPHPEELARRFGIPEEGPASWLRN